MTKPDLVPMLLDVSIDPCDGSVHPSLQYVLIRGFTAMGWEQPKAASEDMAMEILKMVRPSNLAAGPSEATPSTAGSVREALETARDAIQLTIDTRGVDGGGFLLSALNKADAALALSAPVEAPVAVKPLEWISCADYTIHDDLCLYEIEQRGKDWRLIRAVTFGGSYLGHYQTLEAAKAAAQADYEQRIRSALTATPRPLPSVDREKVLALVDSIRAQNWKNGGALAMDRDEAATAILTLLGGSAHG